jgi:hypothetical protein
MNTVGRMDLPDNVFSDPDAANEHVVAVGRLAKADNRAPAHDIRLGTLAPYLPSRSSRRASNAAIASRSFGLPAARFTCMR